MTAIFLKYKDKVSLKSSQLQELKIKAEEAPLKRARFCMHKSHDDMVQEMIIVFCKDSKVPIHKHHAKCESFHMIEGIMEVCFYDDNKKITQTIKLGDYHSGLPFYFRQETDHWHTVRPLTKYVIVHETTKGPFVP
ncbi:WbuC family cupin fold metalloprotein [Desulfobacterales bacterium HSG17]|nr:WbuC family cupin fold metalloprotein [Desulfobacterales bacterium HSG17]